MTKLATDPTALALKECERRGWDATRSEYWVRPPKRDFSYRKDLFGFCDIVAISDACVMAIQVTTRDHASSRRRKINGIDAALRWSRVGLVMVWAYDQPGGPKTRYRLQEQLLSVEMARCVWDTIEYPYDAARLFE